MRYRPHLAVASVALLLLLLCAVCLIWLWQALRAADEGIAAVEPRYARLAGLVRAEKRLQQSLELAGRQLAALAVPKEVDAARAGADLQQKARELAEAAGLQVAASQIFPARMEDELERIWASLTLEGDLAQVQNFLLVLREQRPRMQITTMTIQPDSRRIGRGNGQGVLVTLEISRFRVPG